MENNSVTTKQKTKRLVILLAAIFLVCAVGIGGVYIWKNRNSQPVVENPDDDKNLSDDYVPGDLVLDEEGMPEDGSDITETEEAIDEEALRKLLLADGKFAIELTEDIRIEETLVVNGTKKLVGNKSIIMELYAEPFQSVASVSAGSTLILDGVTLDGNGIANGVTVAKNAGFTGISGKILYPVPYGVIVAGTAKLTGITIDHSADIGLCVEEGGNVSLQGGKIVDSAQSGIHIQPTAQVTISNDALIEGSQYLIRNRGTCVMTGGTLRDASGCLVYSNGEFKVDYQGKDADDRLEWYNACGEAGIRIGNGGTAVVNGVYLHDTTGVGISVVNHAGAEITNTVIANTGSYGFSTYGGKEEAILKDVQILDTKASAVRAHSTTKTTLTNVTVKNTTGFGIKNENNLVVANNVTIENSENTGIWGNKGSTTEVDGATIIKSGKFGVENNSAKMTLKNVKITDPARMGYVGKRESVTTIANMTIENAPERGIYNLGGTVTASDVTVKSTGTYGVSTAKSGEFPGSMTITNLTVTGVKERDGVNCYESVLTVTKGKISGANRHGAIASKGGKMTLTDVEISDCGERGVTGSGGDITLKNVTVKNAGKFGVTTSKSGEYVGQVIAENLTITGVTGNGLNNNASVMKVTNGTISDIEGNGAYAENGAELTLQTVEIKNCAKRGIYLMDAGTKAVLTDAKLGNTSQSSIFQSPGTIVEATNVAIDTSKSYGVFVKGATFTGKNVTVANTTDNSINVSASAEDGKAVVNVTGLNIENAGKRGVANSGGEVTLADVTITNPGTYGATTSKSGEYVGKLDITNLTITGVQKNNALNNNGSVMNVTKAALSDIAGNGAYVENGGQLTLTNVEIKDTEKRGIYVNDAGTKVVLTDTKFSNTGESSIFQEPETVVDATNVSIDKAKSYGIFVKGATFNGKTVTIANTVNNSMNISSSAEDGQAVVTVEGLTVDNAGERGVANVGGLVTLKDVTITNPGTYGATTSKTGEYVGKLDITNLTVTGVQKNNALNCNGSVLNVTNEKIGKISGVAQNGIYVENAGEATLINVEIDDCGKRGVYVNDAETKVSLTNTKILNTTESSIFQEPGTIVEADNVTIDTSESYGVFMKAATLTAKVLKVFNTTNNSLNIDDGDTDGQSVVTVDGLTIENTDNRGVANRGGNVTLTDVTITNAGTYGATTSKVGELVGKLDITNLTITGVNANSALNCNGSVLNVTNEETRKISDVAENGIYVENAGKATLTNVEIDDCGKRGIYVNGADVEATLTNVKVSNTVMTNIRVQGGAKLNATDVVVEMNDEIGKAVGQENFYGICIVGASSQVTIDGEKSTITRNKLGEDEIPDNSAIRLESGSLTIKAGTYSGLKAASGSVIYTKGTLTIEGGIFGSEGKGNVASGRGGAIYCVDGLTTIKGGEFAYNSAAGNIGGGVISCTGNAALEVQGGYFHHNDASYVPSSSSDTVYGGGAIESNGSVTISGGVFEANTAWRGGAVYIDASGSLNITGGVFGGDTEDKGNVAKHRAGVLYIAKRKTASTTADATIKNATFSFNKTTNSSAVSSGVLYIGDDSIVDIEDCTFNNNKADYTGTSTSGSNSYGGVIYMNNATVNITNTTSDKNTTFTYSGAERGGVIYIAGSRSNLTVNEGSFSNNTASVHGGAIFNDAGTVTVNEGNFSYNVASDRGGAILNKKTLTINGGEFANNSAEGTIGGGAISCTGDTTLTVTGGDFHDNTAVGGGAIESNGTVTIEGGTFKKNTAEKGGAVYLETSGRLTVKNGATFGGAEGEGNTATVSGGAIYCSGSSKATIEGGVFSYNTAAGTTGGGAIYGESKTTIEVKGGTFEHNATNLTASKNDVHGGGVINSEGSVVISGGNFKSNKSQKGSVVYIEPTGTLSITGGTFGGDAESGNVSTYRGGVIYIDDRTNAPEEPDVLIKNATFNYNKSAATSAVSGGVMYVGTKAKVEIEGCTFDNNDADYTPANSSGSNSFGGVIYINGASVNVSKNTTFTNNCAERGGAIYVNGSGSLTLENCECTNNVGEKYADDVFCNNGTVNFAEKVVASVDLHNNSKTMNVTKAMTSDSKIKIRALVNGIVNRVVVKIADDVDMDAALISEIFELNSTNSIGKQLIISDREVKLTN